MIQSNFIIPSFKPSAIKRLNKFSKYKNTPRRISADPHHLVWAAISLGIYLNWMPNWLWCLWCLSQTKSQTFIYFSEYNWHRWVQVKWTSMFHSIYLGLLPPLFLHQHKISGFQGYTACLLIMAVRSLYQHFPPLFKCPGSHDFWNITWHVHERANHKIHKKEHFTQKWYQCVIPNLSYFHSSRKDEK